MLKSNTVIVGLKLFWIISLRSFSLAISFRDFPLVDIFSCFKKERMEIVDNNNKKKFINKNEKKFSPSIIF
jgi:hypothetical protein